MGAIIAAGIGAAAGLIGDEMSQSGQRATNVMSMNEMLQQEQWQTEMSNTAMQRRVADLKAAGINPLMAAGGPGATVGGVGTPSLQNPASAFTGLGSQVTSAAQLAAQSSQIELNKAQSANLNAQATKATVDANKAAGVDTDVARQNIAESQSRQVLQDAQAKAAVAAGGLSSAQMAVAQATLPKIQAEIAMMGSQSDLNAAKANVENLTSMLKDLDIQQQTAIMPSLIESAHNAAISSHLGLFEQQALADFFAGDIGGLAPGISQVLKLVAGARLTK